jgi:hypothetical protein
MWPREQTRRISSVFLRGMGQIRIDDERSRSFRSLVHSQMQTISYNQSKRLFRSPGCSRGSSIRHGLGAVSKLSHCETADRPPRYYARSWESLRDVCRVLGRRLMSTIIGSSLEGNLTPVWVSTVNGDSHRLYARLVRPASARRQLWPSRPACMLIASGVHFRGQRGAQEFNATGVARDTD